MNKAIAILKMIATNENLTGVYHNEANQAIAELTAHKEKIESLKEWVSQITNFALASDDFNQGYMQAKINILQKLEELDK